MALHVLREDPLFSSPLLPFDSFFDDEHWDLFTLFRDNIQNQRKKSKQRGVEPGKKPENKEEASDDQAKKASLLFQNPLATAVMASDLIETDKNFIVYLDLPGVKVEDLEVTIQEAAGSGGSQHNVLTIAAERKQPFHASAPAAVASTEAAAEKPAENTAVKLHSQERLYGKIVRRVRLPLTADCDQTTVQLKDGVLAVTLRKKELSVEKKRKLTVLTE
eukprot:gene27181-32837_t